MFRSTRVGALLCAVAVPALLLGGVPANASAKKSAFPVQIKNGETVVKIAKKPVRIVSLSPTSTEMLFAIGAGKQVKAVDDFSNYPANAPKTALSGYKPNVEAIAKYKPDLIVASADGDAMKALRALKIPVLVMPAAVTIDDSYTQMEQLGVATGNVASAVLAVAKMRTALDKAFASASKRTAPLRYYHELDNTYYTVTSKTFVGSLFAKLGMVNVADPADKDGYGYPQISPEYLLKANPDVVLLADTKCCGETAAKFGARPGFAAINAVKNGQVIELDDDVASRWGPRVVDLVTAVAAKTANLSGTPAPVGA